MKGDSDRAGRLSLFGSTLIAAVMAMTALFLLGACSRDEGYRVVPVSSDLVPEKSTAPPPNSRKSGPYWAFVPSSRRNHARQESAPVPDPDAEEDAFEDQADEPPPSDAVLSNQSFAYSAAGTEAVPGGDRVVFPNPATGRYLAKDLEGGGFLALCVDDEGSSIQNVTVENERVITGSACASAFLMIRRDGVRSGPAPMAHLEDRGGTTFVVLDSTEVAVSSNEEGPFGTNIVIQHAGRKRTFVSDAFLDWTQWDIPWAGDVNGDSVPDLIVRVVAVDGDGGDFISRSLFLSRPSEEVDWFECYGGPFMSATSAWDKP